jgi:hypothetical protein
MTRTPNPTLVHEVRAALDEGVSLKQLEDTLLAGSYIGDDVAAAWLFAWAYEAVRPSSDRLAQRVTDGATRSRSIT